MIPISVTGLSSDDNLSSDSWSYTATTSVYGSLAAGSWLAQTTASRITSSGPNPNPSVTPTGNPLTQGQWDSIKGTQGIAASIDSWCGRAWDETTKRIYVTSSGHGDGRFNSTTYYDASLGAGGSWSRFSWPSYPICADTTGINPDNTPDARHTYSSMCVYNGYLYVSGAAVNPNVNGVARLWRQSLTTGVWEYAPSTGLTLTNQNYFTGVCANGGLIWCFNNYGLATIDPSAFQSGFTQRVNNQYVDNWNIQDVYVSMVCDASRSKIWVTGYYNGGSPATQNIVFNISNPAAVTVSNNPTFTGNGATTWINTPYPATGYDSTRADVVGWLGGTTLYKINLTAMTITTEAATGGDTPASYTANGAYNLCVSASLGVILVVNGSANPVYAYKRL